MDLGENHFTWIDYAVVVGTLVGSLGIGIYFALRKQTTEDLLLGGRNMGPLPIAASMMVTYLSAIGILGYPAEIYYHGIEMFTMALLQIIVAPLAAYIIVPVFYHFKLTSVFSYLEFRFESVLSRWIGALIGIVQVLFVMGVILFAPSIAVQHIMGIPYWLSIIGIGICGTVYTSVGGLKAVVWTDVFQLVIILISLGFMIFSKAFSATGGIVLAFEIAAERGRLNLFNSAVDPFMRHNTLNFVVGFGFSMFCQIGTHQPQVQRYSSLPSVKTAQRALILAVPMNIVTTALLAVTGVVIFATYADCDPMKSRKIFRPDQIVPFYLVSELALIPGMLGMFISCIFSAVLSTVSSALNSSAAITWEDFLVKIPFFAKMEDKSIANATKIIAGSFGIATIGFAFLVQQLGPVLPLTMSIMGATGGPLGAIFLIGLFLPWVNKYVGLAINLLGANIGMLTGIVTMFYFSVKAFELGMQHIPLPTSTEGCIPNFTAMNHTLGKANPTIEWPDKIYTMSYLMFPFVGAVNTAAVSILVSIVTGGICAARDVDPDYLHPSIRWVTNSKSHKIKATVTSFRNNVDIVVNLGSKPNTLHLHTHKYEQVPTSPAKPNKAELEETVGEFLFNKTA